MTESRDHLEIVPVSFRQASDFVSRLHRHHKPPRGMKFCLGVVDEAGLLRGVAMVGRPVARSYDTGRICEVNRTCTDGCPNANSALYGAAWRTARGMGYLAAITYTQADESGVSMRGAGWRQVGRRDARGSWRESTADPRLNAMRDLDPPKSIDRILWAVGMSLPGEA